MLHVALLGSNSYLPVNGVWQSLMRCMRGQMLRFTWTCCSAIASLKANISRAPEAARALCSPGEHPHFSMLHSTSGECFSALRLFLNYILFSVSPFFSRCLTQSSVTGILHPSATLARLMPSVQIFVRPHRTLVSQLW